MQTEQYDSFREINYKIIYKKRRTYGIYVDMYGNIELRVPKQASSEHILKMLEEKYEWILKKSNEMKEKTKGFKKKTYDHGDTFLYLGKEYPIQVFETEEVEKNITEFINDVLMVYVKGHEEIQVQEALKRFYHQQCKTIIEQRIKYYQNEIKVKPKSIKLASNKGNWGTCNSKKELTFNWRLIMAPIEVMDYVVVHELCHLLHMNHDRSFWRLVGKYIPEYEERQAWLAKSNWKMVL